MAGGRTAVRARPSCGGDYGRIPLGRKAESPVPWRSPGMTSLRLVDRVHPYNCRWQYAQAAGGAVGGRRRGWFPRSFEGRAAASTACHDSKASHHRPLARTAAGPRLGSASRVRGGRCRCRLPAAANVSRRLGRRGGRNATGRARAERAGQGSAGGHRDAGRACIAQSAGGPAERSGRCVVRHGRPPCRNDDGAHDCVGSRAAAGAGGAGRQRRGEAQGDDFRQGHRHPRRSVQGNPRLAVGAGRRGGLGGR